MGKKKFRFSLYFYYKLCHYRSTKKSLLSIFFVLFIANNALKSFRRAKYVALLVPHSKNIPNNTTPTFQEVGKWVG